MFRSTRAPVRLAALLAFLAAASPLQAQPAQSAGPETSAPALEKDKLGRSNPKGYLSEEATPDLVSILPPPPAGHSAAEAADRAIYNATHAGRSRPTMSPMAALRFSKITPVCSGSASTMPACLT